jgi:hypothetical protein
MFRVLIALDWRTFQVDVALLTRLDTLSASNAFAFASVAERVSSLLAMTNDCMSSLQTRPPPGLGVIGPMFAPSESQRGRGYDRGGGMAQFGGRLSNNVGWKPQRLWIWDGVLT